MKLRARGAVLDSFRLVSALLVVTIHVSPLSSVSATADFVLTRAIARIAVPFFLMTTGYFLAAHEASGDRRYFPAFLKKTAVLYGAAILLYLPLNLYNGYFQNSPLQLMKDLLFNGTFYHLWYLPAVLLGTVVIVLLWRRFGLKAAFAAALALYAVGLGGDSYYGLASKIPLLNAFYNDVFSVSEYTRSGLFLAPVFLLLGAMLRVRKSTLTHRMLIVGLACSGALLASEALLLHIAGVQRHDSMYVMLLPCMYFLFSLLLRHDIQGSRQLRTGAMLVYLIHPWGIVLVRGFAKITGLTGLLVSRPLVLYILVCVISVAAAAAFIYLQSALKKPQPRPDARAWIEVSRAALRHNAAELQRLLPASCRLMAVVKADAYGHGAVNVAGELEKAGVRFFAVATLSEGIALRRGGVKGEVLILGYTPPGEAGLLQHYRLAQTVVDGAYAEALHDTGVPLDVHIKLDTGMHRLGVDCGDMAALERIFRYGSLSVKGVFTHLSQADDLGDAATDFTLAQISRFIDAVNTLKAKGYDTGSLHIQESYGILNYPGLPCDYARAGIALYGVLCKNDVTRLTPRLHPALSLKARIAEVKQVEAGAHVSYGRRFTAEAPMKIAAVTIGYADGIPRNSAARDSYVLLNGQQAPVVGLICMDILLADVTHIDGAAPGDIVTLIGRDGDMAIRCEDVAESCGTITNELLSRLGARLPRIFV